MDLDFLDKASAKVEEKQKKYQEQGFADTTFETNLNGKRIKMFLPNSVFEQKILLNLGYKVTINNF